MLKCLRSLCALYLSDWKQNTVVLNSEFVLIPKTNSWACHFSAQACSHPSKKGINGGEVKSGYGKFMVKK